ncbi:MAG: alpha/beta fold hydrolase, partial [Anaerolineales bacterium]
MRLKSILWLAGSALGGVTGALALTAYARYRRETRAAASRLFAASHMLHTGRGPIEYAETGRGQPVLISHGSGGGFDQGLLIGRLFGGDNRYLAPSRFGYLRSPLPPDAAPAAQAQAFAALLDALNVPQVVMVGVSAGGPAAIEFALRYPERCSGMLLIAAATHSIPAQAPLFTAVGEMALRADFVFWSLITFAPRFVLSSTGLTPAQQARLSPEELEVALGIGQTLLPMSLRRAGLMNDLMQLVGSGAGWPLEKIGVPTLLLHAKDDPLAPFANVERAARTIPGAELI